jgi:hypothetical protein
MRATARGKAIFLAIIFEMVRYMVFEIYVMWVSQGKNGAVSVLKGRGANFK